MSEFYQQGYNDAYLEVIEELNQFFRAPYILGDKYEKRKEELTKASTDELKHEFDLAMRTLYALIFDTDNSEKKLFKH